MSTIIVQAELATIHCGECGGTYAIEARYKRQKHEKGGFWTCPYCKCSWGFSNDTCEVGRLKHKLEQEEARTEQERTWRHDAEKECAHTQRRLRATRGVVTKTKRRIAHGVCPCCKRTFQNLARHMDSKHPSYGKVGKEIQESIERGRKPKQGGRS